MNLFSNRSVGTGKDTPGAVFDCRHRLESISSDLGPAGPQAIIIIRYVAKLGIKF